VYVCQAAGRRGRLERLRLGLELETRAGGVLCVCSDICQLVPDGIGDVPAGTRWHLPERTHSTPPAACHPARALKHEPQDHSPLGPPLPHRPQPNPNPTSEPQAYIRTKVKRRQACFGPAQIDGGSRDRNHPQRAQSTSYAACHPPRPQDVPQGHAPLNTTPWHYSQKSRPAAELRAGQRRAVCLLRQMPPAVGRHVAQRTQSTPHAACDLSLPSSTRHRAPDPCTAPPKGSQPDT
jgi:hypothetical protein